jgi:hypothetical protein
VPGIRTSKRPEVLIEEDEDRGENGEGRAEADDDGVPHPHGERRLAAEERCVPCVIKLSTTERQKE